MRLARAHTGRDKVAFCGYHGWSDWYLAANVSSGGADDNLKEHLLPPMLVHANRQFQRPAQVTEGAFQMAVNAGVPIVPVVSNTYVRQVKLGQQWVVRQQQLCTNFGHGAGQGRQGLTLPQLPLSANGLQCRQCQGGQACRTHHAHMATYRLQG